MSPPEDRAWGAYRLAGWKKAWLGFCHRLPAWPGMRRVALWLRKPLKMALSDWADVTVWGLRLRLFSKGNLSEQRVLLMPQYFDRAERLALAGELAGGGVFLDSGANIGSYSLWAASLGAAVRVEAFEPDAELCNRLRFNLETNRLLDRVRVHNLALGSQRGAVFLERGEINRGQNRVVEMAVEGAEEIRVETLPGFLREAGIDRITALKIDVEGHEVAVLKPMLEEVPRSAWPALIVCEIEKKYRSAAELAVWQLLVDAGYAMEKRARINGLFRLKQ